MSGIQRWKPRAWSAGGRLMVDMVPVDSSEGRYVLWQDHQAALKTLEAQRDALRSAIKQHRNATESRLKLLASSARVPESSDLMLAPDRALYAALDETTPKENGAATADPSPRDASSVGDQSRKERS